jgi:hypothetical protein
MCNVNVTVERGVLKIRPNKTLGDHLGQYDCGSVDELLGNLQPFTKNQSVQTFTVDRKSMWIIAEAFLNRTNLANQMLKR